MGKDNIQLTIVSPEKTLFEGDVRYVQLPGVNGSFSVLYEHAPLLSALAAGEIKFKSAGVTHKIPVKSGFVSVSDNQVSICIEQ